MDTQAASTTALEAVGYIIGDDTLRDRFLALSGTDADDLRARIVEQDFQASVLEFLISHEPDLIDFAEHIKISPETIVSAWRSLGGGEGQEW
jgi:hypothetical protein